MAPSPSPDDAPDRYELELLVDIADDSLSVALAGRTYEPPSLDSLPAALCAQVGAFVTLTVAGSLNGCIGDVAGRQPLAHAVAHLAIAAAFDDPRLPALAPHQYDDLTIEVSVLSPLEPVGAADRADLIASLRPGVDGLVIRAGHRSGLFLPDVWTQLPDPDDFLDHLWYKAGLPIWMQPETIQRFTTRRSSRRAGRSALAPERSG